MEVLMNRYEIYLFLLFAISVPACDRDATRHAGIQQDEKSATLPLEAVHTRELPKDWQIDEIADAMPPRSDDGPTHVLAWKILEDDRPHRVEYCLGVKHLTKATEKQEQWVLASLARNPAKGKEWNFVTIWITPDAEFKNPPFIMHVQKYRDRPTNADIYKFMDKFDWKLGADRDWKLIDGGVCEAWEKVIGEKPIRPFMR
jgi:hypothetical protein